MSKLSTNQASLAGKTSKIALAQEYTAGGNRENLNDPELGFILINSVSGQTTRFNTLAQLQDFIASTGPGGRWPV
jgi:hypothetical protein